MKNLDRVGKRAYLWGRGNLFVVMLIAQVDKIIISFNINYFKLILVTYFLKSTTDPPPTILNKNRTLINPHLLFIGIFSERYILKIN